jgi:hypothetical protein
MPHKDPIRARAWRKEWYKRKPELQREYHRRLDRKLKEAVIAAYGGRCQCCGEDSYEFLTIDHVGGEGQAHKKSVPGRKVYRWLRNNGFPQDGRFQLLCMNCNFAKGMYGQCPHVKQQFRVIGIAC